MKKFEVTTVDKLEKGDRFYFVKDKAKTTYELIEQKSRFNGHLWLSSVVINTVTKFHEHVKNGREVVFLRNNNQTPTT